MWRRACQEEKNAFVKVQSWNKYDVFREPQYGFGSMIWLQHKILKEKEIWGGGGVYCEIYEASKIVGI